MYSREMKYTHHACKLAAVGEEIMIAGGGTFLLALFLASVVAASEECVPSPKVIDEVSYGQIVAAKFTLTNGFSFETRDTPKRP